MSTGLRTFAKSDALSCLRDVSSYKIADSSYRLPSFGEHHREDLPNVNHVLPYVKRHADACKPRPLRQPDGVI